MLDDVLALVFFFCYIGDFEKLQTPGSFATMAACRIGLLREEDAGGACNMHPAASSRARMEGGGTPSAATTGARGFNCC